MGIADKGDAAASDAQDRRPRDLNGRPVTSSRWDRARAGVRAMRVRGSRPATTISIGNAALTVVAQSADDAASSATVLEASSWRPDEQVVVRHFASLPAARVAEAAELAALDGYQVIDRDFIDGAGPLAGELAAAVSAMTPGHALVVFARVQLLDSMHLSQERSRMASLGSRHGGTTLGWQVLQ